MSAAIEMTAPAPAAAARASLLRLLTCGSVDDGKSTLLGRLLYDSHAVLDDQLASLDRDSQRFGTQGQGRDFALLVDGLAAEREQGITIDVAYRYFSTARRAFIVADTPGHEQYTRNMATGASTAELAIILVDARKGILPQTRRHSYIVAMLGVRHVVLAINKMDLVGFNAAAYERIVAGYRRAAAGLGFVSIAPIPISARDGDNVATRSARMPWYGGRTLLDTLETVSITDSAGTAEGFCFPVQWVSRPDPDFRGYAGTLAGGIARVQQPVVVLPGGQRSRIASIVTADGPLHAAVAGQAVTLTLADEIDVSRGDVIVPAEQAFAATTRLTARLLWMVDEPLAVGRELIVKLGTASAGARVAALTQAIDIHTLEPRAADSLAMNGIGVAELAFDKPLVASAYAAGRELGAFILIDRISNQTVALGVVEQVPTAAPADPVAARSHPSPARDRIGRGGRWARWPEAAGRMVGAGALGGVIVALSRDVLLGAVVAAAEVTLCPALACLVRRAWARVHADQRAA